MTKAQITASGLSEEQVARANMSEEQRVKYRIKQNLLQQAALLRLLRYRLMKVAYAAGEAASDAPAVPAGEEEDEEKERKQEGEKEKMKEKEGEESS